MAIQVLQQPGVISFAGDPIIAKAKTTLSGKTFLRIVVKCNVKVIRVGEEYSYTEEYTYSVAEDGLAIFNVGNTVETALHKYSNQDVNAMSVEQYLFSAKYQLIYKELFFNGSREEEGDTLISEWYNAIIGRLSEFERLSMANEDINSIIGNGRMLTRKPKGEMIPHGIDLYIPAVSTVNDVIAYYAIQDSTQKSLSQYTGGVNVPSSLKIGTSSLNLGRLNIDTDSETGKMKTIVPKKNGMIHFLFLNGFGLIESITAITRESLSYSIDSETFIIPSDINFKGYTRITSYSKTPQAQLKMSSGYVNREWAEWWVNEFFPTRMAWMLLDGRYIPVAIIPEKENKLFDRSKPGMMAVQFNVQYSFAGGTSNLFS